MTVDREQLSQAIEHCMVRDQYRLRRQLARLDTRLGQAKPADPMQAELLKAITQSQGQVGQRQGLLPDIEFPEQLPISQKRDVIGEAVAQHQVVIVAGETGSGKTTQLPKICLAQGRGLKGMIGHTQPRRIAARSVATRIAEELKVALGEVVGYQVRFTDHSSQNSLIKLMTDGILLAEIQNDPYLNRYDTLIIDEAHERSLNIDFLLGYLKQLLPKRPDLKIIVTSATIDVERLSKFFFDAPIVEVSGRTFPVEVNYCPLGEGEDRELDLPSAIVSMVEDIVTGPNIQPDAQDILVFLAGEKDIRQTANALRKAQLPHLDILPLYARLSAAEQTRVFQSHRGRRVVLATNVAETSITVPGIGYVIDPGTARVSRYSYRTKVQRLPIEPVSQASANQRMGRAGRMAPGVAYRLYSEEDFLQRPEFTEPEILRSNLASVILRMLQLGLGDIHQFPFVDVPDHRLINDGFKLLEALEALTPKGTLSEIGRQLCQFPIDPRLARMCLAAGEHGCLREVLIIVSALTVQDPRERPADKQQQADEKHRRFHIEGSDFLAYIQLWNYAEEQRQELSQNQWRQRCKKEFLSFLRLREWRDLHHQLRLAIKPLGLKENQEPAEAEAIHRALLFGLSNNIGMLAEDRQYLGPRNRHFSVFPGSSLFKQSPKWVACGELLETSKLYAHQVAKVEPEWILAATEHLVKRHHSEPHYHRQRGQVMAYERITLYGLTLVERKRVPFAPIDPAGARECFIRAALVEEQYQNKKSTPAFYTHNRALRAEILELEAKTRRRDIMVEDDIVYEFFAERIPAEVVDLRSFERWRKSAEKDSGKLLFLSRERLMSTLVDTSEAQFPNEVEWGGMSYQLSYQFAPSQAEDGVTLHVPLQALHLLKESDLQWLVPGLLREKCVQLVKALPKQYRKHFVPVPETVDKIFPKLLVAKTNDNIGLYAQLHKLLQPLLAAQLPQDCWQSEGLDDFYRFNIRVEDEKGKRLDSGRDLAKLLNQFRDRLQKGMRQASEKQPEAQTSTDWMWGALPESEPLNVGGVTTIGFPTLIADDKGVRKALLDNPAQAAFQLRHGIARLLLLQARQSAKYLKKSLLKDPRLALALIRLGDRDTLVDDLLLAAMLECAVGEGTLPRSHEEFEAALQRSRSQLTDCAQRLEAEVLAWAELLGQIQSELEARANKAPCRAMVADIKQQLDDLFAPHFLVHTPRSWLQQYRRYLQGMVSRMEKFVEAKDQQRLAELDPHRQRVNEACALDEQAKSSACERYRWMVEEFRLSLFAQPMKTLMPISAKRLEKQWDVLQRE